MSTIRRPTKERVLTEALRLFGEHGYAGTSVAQIEAAAGLSPGSGSLYRHFASKQELLAEAVRSHLSTGDHLVAMMDGDAEAAWIASDVDGPPGAGGAAPVAAERRDRIAALCRAGLTRLHQDRDLSRLMVRDLAAFPELLAEVRQAEMSRIQHSLAHWLAAEASRGGTGPGQDQDWAAVSTVLVGALANYWQLTDVFGTHPSGVDEERFIDALVDLTEAALDPGARDQHEPGEGAGDGAAGCGTRSEGA